jgi:hypothetical protein
MRKPVQFLRPRNVNGPLYQTGEIAGFAPDLADALIADGSAKEPDAIAIEVGRRARRHGPHHRPRHHRHRQRLPVQEQRRAAGRAEREALMPFGTEDAAIFVRDGKTANTAVGSAKVHLDFPEDVEQFGSVRRRSARSPDVRASPTPPRIFPAWRTARPSRSRA